MNRGFYILILLPIVVSLVVAVVETMRHIRSRKRAATNVVAFLRANFAQLANSDGLITERSLTAAKQSFPENRVEIAIIRGELDTIGHKIGEDNASKGAIAVNMAVSAPSMTPLAMASDFAVYAISKEDAERVSRVEAGFFGGIDVWKFSKKS